MAPILLDIPTPVPPDLQSPLEAHLPHSFTLLRRAQFTHFPGGTSPHAHFLFAYHAQSQKGDNPSDAATLPSPTPKHFAAAYLDLTQHPSTQMFLYSTLQDAGDDDAVQNLPQADVEQVLDLCAAVFRRVRHLAQVAAPETVPADRLHSVMVGNFHEATYRLLVERRGLASSYWNPHDVWLFRVDELPPPTAVVEEGEGGLVWSVVRREDVPLIASRTSIPKVAETLMVEPSLAVRDGAGRLVAWGFMGLAGTLSTLHVEEPYRGKGIAKALATRVLREHSFGDDPWGAADVHVDNVQSQGLCNSLGGKKGMRTCWSAINFDSMPSS